MLTAPSPCFCADDWFVSCTEHSTCTIQYRDTLTQDSREQRRIERSERKQFWRGEKSTYSTKHKALRAQWVASSVAVLLYNARAAIMQCRESQYELERNLTREIAPQDTALSQLMQTEALC